MPSSMSLVVFCGALIAATVAPRPLPSPKNPPTKRSPAHTPKSTQGPLSPHKVVPTQTVSSPDLTPGGRFGSAIAVAGDQVFVGAPDDHGGARKAGAVHVFDAKTGRHLRSFNNPKPSPYDRFGRSISVSGRRLLVGVPGAGDDEGRADLFDIRNGRLLRTFEDPHAARRNAFGASVSVDGDRVVIDSPQYMPSPKDRGRAYLFSANTGALVRTFANPHPDMRGSMRTVLVQGNTILIASRDHVSGDQKTGVVWIYDATTGSRRGRIISPKQQRADGFASALAMVGNRLFVGAPGASYNVCGPGEPTCTADGGSVFEFDATSRRFVRRYDSPKGWSDGRFGVSVAAHGGVLAVGEIGYRRDNSTRYIGAAHLFDTKTGAHIGRFDNPTPAGYDQMGSAVGVAGNRFIVGASGDDHAAKDAGLIYFADVPGRGPVTRPGISPKKSKPGATKKRLPGG